MGQKAIRQAMNERVSNVNRAQVIQVVAVESITGKGTTESPVREITEYYSIRDGKLLARIDHWLDEQKAGNNENP